MFQTIDIFIAAWTLGLIALVAFLPANKLSFIQTVADRGRRSTDA